jgi:hypothetical protein
MSIDKGKAARRKRVKRRTKLKQKKHMKPDQRRRKLMIRGQRGGRRQ